MVDYGGHGNISAFGAPGLLNVYEANLRVAIGKSQFTQEVIAHIASGDIAARRFLSGVGEQTNLRIRWRLPEDRQRQDKYKLCSDLFFGRHERHLRPEWMPTGKMSYKTINWMRFVTKVYVDLMMGGGVEVKTGNELVDDYIVEEAKLPLFFSDWATSGSIFGMTPLQIVSDDDGVDIIKVDPLTVYFQFKEGTHDDFEWIAKKVFIDPSDVQDPTGNWTYGGSDEADNPPPDGVIFEERHYRGRIEYYLYTVQGDEIIEILDPQWFQDTLPPMDDDGFWQQPTDCKEFLLQLIPNVLLMKEFISDYDDLIDLQASINLRATQRGRILNVHADPKLMLPESLQQKDIYTGEVIVRGLRDEVFFLAPDEYQFKPEYLTWDAQLEQVQAELEDDQALLCTLAEISPTLVVGRDESFPESGAAYKMKLTPTLNRVNRKKKDFTLALQILLHTFVTKVVQAGLLDSLSPTALPDQSADEMPTSNADPVTVSLPGMPPPQPLTMEQFLDTFKPGDIDLDFKPALPQDEKMMVERLAGQASISRERVLKQVDGMTDEEVAKEIAKMDEDQKGQDEAAFPGNFGGGGAFDPVDDRGTMVPPGQPLEIGGGLSMLPGQAAQTDVITSDMI